MIHVRMLGGLDVRRNGIPMEHLGPILGRFLAYLLLQDGVPATSSKVAAEVWGHGADPNIVRINVKRLREALQDDNYVISNASGISLDMSVFELDIVTFQQRAKETTIQALEAAADLYRAELLHGWYENWLLDMREKLVSIYCQVLDLLTSMLIEKAKSELQRTIYYLRRLVTSCPDSEVYWARLIHAYILAEQPHRALWTYRRYVDFTNRENKLQNIPIKISSTIEDLIKDVILRIQTESSATIRATNSTPVGLPAHESVRGAVRLGSPFYIERPEDHLLNAILAPIQQHGVTVRIRGSYGIGKSSLLARAIDQARKQNVRVICMDFQTLTAADMVDLDGFYKAFARTITAQLDLDCDPIAHFKKNYGGYDNFARFLRREVEPELPGPLMICLDNADTIFSYSFCNDVFGQIRAWHNDRQYNSDGLWHRTSVVIAYSIEASLFITNADQSPFNVAESVELSNLTLDQASELNGLYGIPLKPDELAELYSIISGHPYLLRKALSTVQQHKHTATEVLDHAHKAAGIYANHLDRIRFALFLDPDLVDRLRVWLEPGSSAPSDKILTEEQIARLIAAGMITGNDISNIRVVNPLYERYLRRIIL